MNQSTFHSKLERAAVMAEQRFKTGRKLPKNSRTGDAHGRTKVRDHVVLAVRHVAHKYRQQLSRRPGFFANRLKVTLGVSHRYARKILDGTRKVGSTAGLHPPTSAKIREDLLEQMERYGILYGVGAQMLSKGLRKGNRSRWEAAKRTTLRAVAGWIGKPDVPDNPRYIGWTFSEVAAAHAEERGVVYA